MLVRWKDKFLEETVDVDRLHGRQPEADRQRRDGDDSVPRARRREPRPDGLEHDAPVGAAPPAGGAGGRHGRRVPRRLRLAGRARGARWGHGRQRDRRSHPGRARRGRRARRVQAQEVPALEPGHLHQPAPRRGRRRPRGGRPGPGRWLAAPMRARWRWARTSSSPSSPGRVATTRTPSSSASASSRTTCSRRIHIEKYEIEARDTKLGPEEITRDIPNVGEESLRNLDEDGIIYEGAEVRPATSWSARSRRRARPS